MHDRLLNFNFFIFFLATLAEFFIKYFLIQVHLLLILIL